MHEHETRMTFRGFGGEQEHERLMDYLGETLVETLDSFLPKEGYQLDLKVHHDNLRNNHKNQRFECEAVVRIIGEKNPIVVRKGDENFRKAVHACESTLRKLLTRRTRVRTSQRRQKGEWPIPA